MSARLMPERHDHPIVLTADDVTDRDDRLLEARIYGREFLRSLSKGFLKEGIEASVLTFLIVIELSSSPPLVEVVSPGDVLLRKPVVAEPEEPTEVRNSMLAIR